MRYITSLHLLTFFSNYPWEIKITWLSSHNKETAASYCCMWTECYLAKDICHVPHHRASPRNILMKYEIWSASSSSRGARCWNVRFWGKVPQNSFQGVTIFKVVWIYHIGFLLRCLAWYQLCVNKMVFLQFYRSVSLCNITVVFSSLRNFTELHLIRSRVQVLVLVALVIIEGVCLEKPSTTAAISPCENAYGELWAMDRTWARITERHGKRLIMCTRLRQMRWEDFYTHRQTTILPAEIHHRLATVKLFPNMRHVEASGFSTQIPKLLSNSFWRLRVKINPLFTQPFWNH